MTNKVDLNVQPYCDDYDATKEYTQIVAVPGRVEQAREFTQVQTLLKDFLRRLGDSVLRDGTIIDGCSIVISGTDVKITGGKIYFDGLVRLVSEQNVTIAGSGMEYIGVKLNQEIVRETLDASLKDPASGYDNYGQPGAHRLKETVQIVVNDPDSVVIYVLENGALYKESVTSGSIDRTLDMLARRTYDESGNYKVYGLELIYDSKVTDENNICTTLESGKAYVKGYEVVKSVSMPVLVPKSLTTRLRTGEPKTYSEGTLKYVLNSQPVKQVHEVRALLEKTISKTRGSVANGIDYLPDSSVDSIVSVTQGAATYTPNSDYILTDDGVDWSPLGIEPDPGSTYTVTYRYLKVMEIGVDYKVTEVDSKTSIDFTGMPGVRPVNNSSIQVDYEFYLARHDIFGIDKEGNVIIIPGQPNIERLVAPPVYNNPDVLKLGTILCLPNSAMPQIINTAVTRTDMAHIYNLIRRVEQVEYNQALSDLDTEAIEGEQATELKGVFTDGFIGFTKADIAHPDFDSCIDIEKGELTLSFDAGVRQLTVDSANIIGHEFNTLITAPFSEAILVSQVNANKAMLINPYAVFTDESSIELSPSVDSWVDENTLTIDGGTNVSTRWINSWWWDWNWWGGSGMSQLQAEQQALSSQGFTGNASTMERINSATRKVMDEAILYMRPITVTITGKKFAPHTDKLRLTFDSKPVTLNTNLTYQGSEAGTAKADANGMVQATFTIPSGVRTGTRAVVLSNGLNTASTNFTAEGRKRTYETVISRDVVVFRENVITRSVDPLAQSFSFDTDRLITAIDVYFAVKDNSHPITIQVRNMVNGYPGTTCYGEKVLYPQDVNVSEDSTVATKVVFNDPILCRANEQYCFAILTESTTASVYVAELGSIDIATGSAIAKQPYTTGVLFSSSNAQTWTAHQTADMKFRIYGASFTGNGVIPFTEINNLDSNRLVVASDFASLSGTKCLWECKIGNSLLWEPIAAFNSRELPEVTDKLGLRAILEADNTASSVITKESLNLASFKNLKIGYYVTKNVAMSETFNTVKQYVELNLPPGTSALIQFAVDTDGVNWITPTQISADDLGNGWVKYAYSYSFASGEEKTNFRARVKLETNNPAILPKARKLMNVLKMV